jgi:hypothetical protein
MTTSNAVVLSEINCDGIYEEEIIELYKNNNSFIRFVRDYKQQEYIEVSNDILLMLFEENRPLESYIFSSNFHLLKRYKSQIKQHILETNQLRYFYRLFGTSMSKFFDSL